MKVVSLLAIFVLLVLACWGCSSADEITEVSANATEFVGKPEARFEGTWKSENGVSTYKLKGDGTYELDSKITVQGQKPIDSHLEGEWKVNGSEILFKDASGNVAPYAFTFSGERLELSLKGSMKAKTVLIRQ